MKLRGLIALLVIVGLFASPLVNTDDLRDGFLVGRRIWLLTLSIFVCGGIAARLVLAIVLKSPRIDFSRVDAVVALALVSIWAHWQFLNGSLVKAMTYSSLVVFYFALRYLFELLSESWLLKVSLVASALAHVMFLYIGVLVIMQKYEVIASTNDYFKATGPFGNPAHCANYLIAISPFYFFIFFFSSDTFKWHRGTFLLAFASISLTLYVLVLLDSRGSWVGLAAVLTVLFLSKRTSLLTVLQTSRVIVPIFLTSCVLAGSLLVAYRPQSVYGRFAIWRISGKIFLDNTVVGVGYGNFAGEYALYQAAHFAQGQNAPELSYGSVTRQPFNVFLQIACEQGLLGLVLFASLLTFISIRSLSLLRECDGIRKSFGACCIACIVGILVFGQFSYPFDLTYVYSVFFLSIGILEGLYHSAFKSKKTCRLLAYGSVKQISLTLIGVLLIALSVRLGSFTIGHYTAYEKWALVEYEELDSMGKLYKALNEDVDFIDEYIEKLQLEGINKDIVAMFDRSNHRFTLPSTYINLAQAYKELGNNKKAEEYFMLAANMIPGSFYNKYRLWLFYLHTEQIRKAKILSNVILKMKVKVPSSSIEAIKNSVRTQIKSFH
jgi:O-antigen ligase